jgi:hypothetical protein
MGFIGKHRERSALAPEYWIMATKDVWESLLQSVQRIGDAQLKNEILGKVARMRDDIAAHDECLRAQQSEIADLRARIPGGVDAAARPAGFVYDPPV